MAVRVSPSKSKQASTQFLDGPRRREAAGDRGWAGLSVTSNRKLFALSCERLSRLRAMKVLAQGLVSTSTDDGRLVVEVELMGRIVPVHVFPHQVEKG
jgi:hypothetical protein